MVINEEIVKAFLDKNGVEGVRSIECLNDKFYGEHVKVILGYYNAGKFIVTDILRFYDYVDIDQEEVSYLVLDSVDFRKFVYRYLKKTNILLADSYKQKNNEIHLKNIKAIKDNAKSELSKEKNNIII